MKNTVKAIGLRFILWSCLIFIVCTAAVTSVPNTSKRVGAVISLDKMDILYVGLDNPVSIAVSGYEPDQVTVMTEGVMLRPTGKALCYTINPDGQTKKAKISVFVKGRKDAVCIKECSIMPVPEPELVLGSHSGPTISKDELLNINSMKLKPGHNFILCDVSYQVQSYTIVHAKIQGGKPTVINVTGNNITPEVQQSFQSASSGDVVAITEVKFAGPGGRSTMNGPTLIVE